MPGSLVLSTSTLLGFMLTLARIAGVFVFVPLPGRKSGVDAARVVMTLSVTLALYPQWPRIQAVDGGLFFVWVLSEAALGIGIGLAVGFAAEAFSMAAQAMGMQAGYGYASTIDPTTQADSTVLVVFAQFVAGLLFFSIGLDREVIRIFARSMETYPPGSFILTRSAAEQILAMGSTMLSTGLRLALPVIGVLIMIDLSLALLGRINSQLQLLTIAFPVKMLTGLAILGWLAVLFPVVFRGTAESTFSVARAFISR